MCSFAEEIIDVEVEPLNGKVHFHLNNLQFVSYRVGAINMSTLWGSARNSVKTMYI